MKTIIITILLLSGCSVGAIDPSNAAADAYDAEVLPLVGRCLPCHGLGNAPNLTSFAALQPTYYAKPGAASLLVTKGDHEGVSFLSADERAVVTTWIDELP